MNEQKDLDQRLRFIVEAQPRMFLFIKVSTTVTYEHVVTKLYEYADVAIVKLSEEVDILEEIKNVKNNSVLLDVQPTQYSLFKRLDYLRDSLHGLNKSLIFIFFMEQYDRVICDYPDFCAYASSLLDYSVKISVPFTFIFSNRLISNDKKNILSSSTRMERQGTDPVSFIIYGINRLKHTRMNAIELQELDNAVFKLVAGRAIKDDKKIVDLVLQYLEVLSSKELFDMVSENLINLYNSLYRKEDVVFDVNSIFVRSVATLIGKGLTDSERDLLDRTVKLLITYYSYSNKDRNLVKALQLSMVHVNYVRENCYKKGKGYSDNLLAESYNDKLILEYMTERHAEKRLADIDFLGSLDLDYENAFLYHYNKAVLLLLSEKYEEASGVCDEFMESYARFKGTGMAYYRIQSVKIWIDGMYRRNLQEAIDSNIDVLRNHRSVFSENHYSIAEFHFCNAYMYYELKDMGMSKHCLTKAKNILKQNHSARVEGLNALVVAFERKLEY